ncbi:hypothetical protein [Dysgonomonas sp. 25]|uniref:hypothetical protein n=1 Tax=Dysgonomonas sp. 25 TaxID=2302933 RepID=UPI0013D184DA|nr:hypothetical protein [Dysgonomonas sp. 25]NDV69152.1 hypothetical protein [Dysgonomonas sp. 25]
MVKLKQLILFTLLFAAGLSLYGQKASVRATIEPADILIGEQAVISVYVTAPKDMNVFFPVFNDSIVKGVEVLGMIQPDTTMTEVMTIRQQYVITSFDSTLYHIPGLPVLADNDTLYTNTLGLKVTAPDLNDSTLVYLEVIKNGQAANIDFNKLGVNDIKDIQAVKWSFLDMVVDFVITFYPYVLLFIGLVIVAGLVIFFLYRKKKKGYYFKAEVIKPPHVIALNELDKLKNSKIWQKGQTKEYYTRLTDILRNYIDGRFGIDAPEMTSDEIIEAVHRVTDTASSTVNLEQILRLADLVKFARYTPLTDEDDLSMMNAYLFVNQTKIEEVVTTKEGEIYQPVQASEEVNTNNDANSKKEIQ